MKRIAIIAALLATTACEGLDTSKEGLTNQATDLGNKARGAVEGWLAQLQGEPDQAKTEQAKAETGEVEIGEAAAVTPLEAPAADPVAPAPQATAAAEATVEQKIEEARKAVVTLLPAGTYTWGPVTGQGSTILTINADGSGAEKTTGGRVINEVQLRKVGEDACFELLASKTIGYCYQINGPDESGAYLADGTNGPRRKTKLVPVG